MAEKAKWLKPKKEHGKTTTRTLTGTEIAEAKADKAEAAQLKEREEQHKILLLEVGDYLRLQWKMLLPHLPHSPSLRAQRAANGVEIIPLTTGNLLICRNGQEIELVALEFC
jgi:hypothetical protein